MIITTALLCLALNTYHEARGESISGQHAVAQVTMNRAEGDPKKVCKVVTAKSQFSWTNRNVGLATVSNGKIALTPKGVPRDKKAWKMAVYVAQFTLQGVMPNVAYGATHYHTKAVRPVWDRKMKVVATYGNHRFYRSI